jgi:hypothetical protein
MTRLPHFFGWHISRRRKASPLTNGSVRVWPVWSTAADILIRVSGIFPDEWRLYGGEGTPTGNACPALPPGVAALPERQNEVQ